MSDTRRRALGVTGLGLLVGLAVFAGIVPGRSFRDARPDGALTGFAAQFHESLMRLEERVPAGRDDLDTLSKAYLRAVDEALAKKDVDGAVRAWHDAYGAAFGSRHWQAMLEVGDAFLRIGQAAGSLAGSKPNARQAYLIALLQARRQGSLDGVLRATEAFATLGDHEVVKQGLRIALLVAGSDPLAQARVREAIERSTAQARAAKNHPNEGGER